MKVTLKAIGNGYHDVYVDGVKCEKYGVENMSVGISGRGTANNYGIWNSDTGRVQKIGSLKSCRVMLERYVHEDATKS